MEISKIIRYDQPMVVDKALWVLEHPGIAVATHGETSSELFIHAYSPEYSEENRMRALAKDIGGLVVFGYNRKGGDFIGGAKCPV